MTTKTRARQHRLTRAEGERIERILEIRKEEIVQILSKLPPVAQAWLPTQERAQYQIGMLRVLAAWYAIAEIMPPRRASMFVKDIPEALMRLGNWCMNNGANGRHSLCAEALRFAHENGIGSDLRPFPKDAPRTPETKAAEKPFNVDDALDLTQVLAALPNKVGWRNAAAVAQYQEQMLSCANKFMEIAGRHPNKSARNRAESRLGSWYYANRGKINPSLAGSSPSANNMSPAVSAETMLAVGALPASSIRETRDKVESDVLCATVRDTTAEISTSVTNGFAGEQVVTSENFSIPSCMNTARFFDRLAQAFRTLGYHVTFDGPLKLIVRLEEVEA